MYPVIVFFHERKFSKKNKIRSVSRIQRHTLPIISNVPCSAYVPTVRKLQSMQHADSFTSTVPIVLVYVRYTTVHTVAQ